MSASRRAVPHQKMRNSSGYPSWLKPEFDDCRARLTAALLICRKYRAYVESLTLHPTNARYVSRSDDGRNRAPSFEEYGAYEEHPDIACLDVAGLSAHFRASHGGRRLQANRYTRGAGLIRSSRQSDLHQNQGLLSVRIQRRSDSSSRKSTRYHHRQDLLSRWRVVRRGGNFPRVT
jgi:hypothetical protein